MEDTSFDQLAKTVGAGSRRTLVQRFVAALPVLGGLVALLDQGKVDAKGRRTRHKKPHHARNLSAEKKHKKKSRKKKRKKCKPQPLATTCAGTCGQVINNCKKTVDCGSCACDPPCPACQVCDEEDLHCVPDPDQQGDDCGAPGQVCHSDGSCACDASSCAPCATCQGDGACSDPCDGSGCCDGGACVDGTSDTACGTGGAACHSCTLPQTCGGGGNDGVCGCTPDCSGKVCGDDGCGATCGDCSGNATCEGGQCVDPYLEICGIAYESCATSSDGCCVAGQDCCPEGLGENGCCGVGYPDGECCDSDGSCPPEGSYCCPPKGGGNFWCPIGTICCPNGECCPPEAPVCNRNGPGCLAS
jgi:hypothetical protein